MKTALVAENEVQLAKTLTKLLHNQGLQVTSVSTVAAALTTLERKNFDLLVVDRLLDDGDGLDLVEYAKDMSQKSRVLCLSQLGSVNQRVRGLQSGADDYMAKPFSIQEFTLKVSKLLAIQKVKTEQAVKFSDGLFYPTSGVLEFPNQKISFRRKESEILQCLYLYRQRVVSRELLIDHVWGQVNDAPSYTTLDVYIRRIRVLLGKHHHVIKTVRGFGYLLNVSEATES